MAAGLHAELLSLAPVTDWTCTVQDDELLTGFANRDAATTGIELPLALEAGQEVWLDVDRAAIDEGQLLTLDADAGAGDRLGGRRVPRPDLDR